MEIKSNFVIGVDVGGSHVSACLLNSGGGAFVTSSFLVRKEVSADGESGEIVDAWAVAIESCAETWPQRDDWRIGIAMPGPFDYEQGISLIKDLHKFDSLYGLNVREMLALRLGIDPGQIRMMNDASAFLLGEMRAGAGRGYSRAAGITLGTGLGSAHYFDHVLYDGDLWCTPFKDLRAEDYLCSRWFLEMYEIVKASKAESIEGKPAITGVRDLVLLYDEDFDVRMIFNAFGRHLAEILFLKYPPPLQDVVIIGGNIAKAWPNFMSAALAWCHEQGTVMNFRPAELGEMAALVGAAGLWKE
jgi:glucokinase